MNPEAQTEAPNAPAQFDPLAAFANWFIQQPLGIHQLPFDGVTKVGAFSGVVLYRKAPFQVQLWLADPNSEIPDHSHPHIDQIQQYLSGELSMRLNGNVVMPMEAVKDDGTGLSTAKYAHLRVRPTDNHGATIGPRGACFMNFQYFLDNNPRSGHLDWEGEPLSHDHAIAIQKP